MGTYAVNDKTGEVMEIAGGGSPRWTPVPNNRIADDPNTGEIHVYNGSEWEAVPSASQGLVADVGRNILTGAAKGTRDIVAMPNTVARLLRETPGPAQPNMAAVGQGRGSASWGLSRSGLPVGNVPAPSSQPGWIERHTPSMEDMNRHLFKDIGLPYYTPSTGLGRIGQMAVEGGVGGAVAGLPGVAAGMVGGAAQQSAAELGAPTGIQVAAGLLAPSVGAAGARAARLGFRTLSDIVSPQLASGQRRIAAGVLRDSAGGPFQPTLPAVEGTPETLGQSTNNPGLLALERTATRRTPVMQGRAQQMRSNANQRVVDELHGLGNVPARGENTMAAESASVDMRAELMASEQAARDVESAAWRAVDQGRNLQMPAQPIRNGLNILRRNVLGPSREDLLPGYIQQVLDRWGNNVSLNDLVALRSRVLGDIRRLRSGPQPDANTAGALDQVADMLLRHTDNLAATDPATQQALEAARQATRDYHATWDHPAIRSAISQSGGAFDRVNPSAMASKIIKLGGGGQESLDAYIRATGGDANALQAARDYVVAKMMKRSQSVQPDLEGDQFLLAGQMRKFLDENAGLINHPALFTPEQRDILRRVAEENDRLARTARAGMPGGSDTYANLAGDSFLQALVGRSGAQILKLFGAAVGGKLAGPVGMAGGYAAGRAMTNSLYGRARDRVLELVDQALLDPEFAAQLQQYARNPQAGPPPRLRAILGTAPLQLEDQRNRR